MNATHAAATSERFAYYMAPEQALGRRLDHKCDVYSLGIVAYELLFGNMPFTGDSPVEVLLKHVNEPLPVPTLAGRLPLKHC